MEAEPTSPGEGTARVSQGYYQLLVADTGREEVLLELQARDIPAAALPIEQDPFLVARVPGAKFGAFAAALMGVQAQPLVFTNPDFEILLSDAAKLGLLVVDLVVEGADLETQEQLAGLLDEKKVDELVPLLRRLHLTISGLEFYTRGKESAILYGSGLIHLEGDPIRDRRWSTLISELVVDIARRA